MLIVLEKETWSIKSKREEVEKKHIPFWRTAWELILHPQKAAVHLASSAQLKNGMLVYFLSFVISCLFYASVPRDLPSQFTEYLPPIAEQASNPFFWLRLGFWGLILLLLNVMFLWFLIRLFRGRISFQALLSFAAWLHLFYLLMFIPMEIGIQLTNEKIFFFGQMFMGLWVVGVTILGVKAISHLSIPKSFSSLLISTFFSLGILFLFKWNRWISSEEIKILLLF